MRELGDSFIKRGVNLTDPSHLQDTARVASTRKGCKEHYCYILVLMGSMITADTDYLITETEKYVGKTCPFSCINLDDQFNTGTLQ